MIQVTMEDVGEKVQQLIQQAIAGEEVVILSDNQPVVRLTAVKVINGERKSGIPSGKGPLVFGSARDRLIHMAEDFDEPLEDFAEYM